MKSVILLAATMLASLPSPASGGQCVVDLDIRSAEAGRTVEGVEAALTDAGYHRLTGPCDYYEVRLRAPGHYIANLIVPALSERNTMRVDLIAGQLVSEPLKKIKGRIVGAGIEKRRLWVKFVKTRGIDDIAGSLPLHSDVVVEESGAFEISGVRGGQYVVLVFEDTFDEFGRLEPTLIAAEPFSIERGGSEELREMDLLITLED